LPAALPGLFAVSAPTATLASAATADARLTAPGGAPCFTLLYFPIMAKVSLPDTLRNLPYTGSGTIHSEIRSEISPR
jgi:hypothetical protein